MSTAAPALDSSAPKLTTGGYCAEYGVHLTAKPYASWFHTAEAGLKVVSDHGNRDGISKVMVLVTIGSIVGPM